MKRPRTEGLPDPCDCKDETEATICAAANDRIDQLIDQPPTKCRKRGEYSVYSDQTRLNIAKSALEIGVNKTARKFSQQLGKKVNESTVRNMKKSYLQHLQKGDHPTSLPKSPRGRPLMLGDIDQSVQTFTTNARINGAAVGTRMVMAAAEGIVTKTTVHVTNSLLMEAISLLPRHGHSHYYIIWATFRGKGPKMSNMYRKTLTSYETTG